jgi:hypothetical protein
MASGLPEDYLVGLTKPSVDRILKMENPGDCLALYTFYCYTRKWQKNSSVFATSEFAMTALGWGRDRFSNAKKQLKDSGFINDIARKGEDGKVTKWYVEVKFAQSATLANFHTTENLHCGKTPDKYLGMVNEIPSNSNEIQSCSTEAMLNTEVKPNDFDVFWNAYPKKVSKEQARKAWSKLKPDLSVIIPLIEKFKASKQWQDKQYIPNPDTFIRNKRWEDEIVVPSTTNQLLNVRSIPNGKVPVWQQIKDSGESEQAREWLMENIPDLPSYELRAVEERHLIDYKNRLQSVEF